MSDPSKLTNAELAAKLREAFPSIMSDSQTWLANEAAVRIIALEAELATLRNRAEAEGFWLGKTTEKEPGN